MAIVKPSQTRTLRPNGKELSLFDDRVVTRSAVIAVVGLGYVGLPLAVAHAQRGFRVLGVDIDRAKVAEVNAGRSYIRDVTSAEIADAIAVGRLVAHTSFAALKDADVIFICVPTPYTRNKEPDTSCIAAAASSVAPHLRPGHLVILRSTSYPGTTQELVKPILERGGYRVGKELFLAFAPERVDPGRKDYTIHNTPVVVGGCDPESTRRATLLFRQVTDRVVPVSSPAAAELAKLLENVFRNVNIALVNQLALFCDRMGLDVWEVLDAAGTKPYGFMTFQPGPGIGGHCIPVDPYYLAWKAREYDFHMDFIELAARVNEDMPYHVVQKAMLLMKDARRPSPRALILGVAFKRDVEDSRDSPAVKILQLLEARHVQVSYHDPLVREIGVNGHTQRSVALTEEQLRAADCVLILTDHSSIDYDFVVQHARRVFDTRNATRHVKTNREKITRL